MRGSAVKKRTRGREEGHLLCHESTSRVCASQRGTVLETVKEAGGKKNRELYWLDDPLTGGRLPGRNPKVGIRGTAWGHRKGRSCVSARANPLQDGESSHEGGRCHDYKRTGGKRSIMLRQQTDARYEGGSLGRKVCLEETKDQRPEMPQKKGTTRGEMFLST